MTTTPEAYLDAMPIDHLDHDPACEIVLVFSNITTRIPCPDTADWWIASAAHCVPDVVIHRFVCNDHHQFLTTGGRARCLICADSYEVLPRIIRTERIQ